MRTNWFIGAAAAVSVAGCARKQYFVIMVDFKAYFFSLRNDLCKSASITRKFGPIKSRLSAYWMSSSRYCVIKGCVI